MAMFIASLNANNAPMPVYNIQINFVNAVSLLMMILPSESDAALKRYMTDEPGISDKDKNKPAHHIRKPIQINQPKHDEFPRENNTKANGIIGTKSTLNCYVGLINANVSWLKLNNDGNNSTSLLTDNNNTLVEDKRFLATNNDNLRVWNLHIRYTKSSDAGHYECRVSANSTRNSFSIYVTLQLFEAHAVILGPNLREVDRGFPIRLSCILNFTNEYRLVTKLQRPTYMFWYHDSRMINYEIQDRTIVREGRLGTELIIQKAQPEHAGNYTCVPSNARQTSVQVVVNYQGDSMSLNLDHNNAGIIKNSKEINLLIILYQLWAFHFFE